MITRKAYIGKKGQPVYFACAEWSEGPKTKSHPDGITRASEHAGDAPTYRGIVRIAMRYAREHPRRIVKIYNPGIPSTMIRAISFGLTAADGGASE